MIDINLNIPRLLLLLSKKVNKVYNCVERQIRLLNMMLIL